MAFPTIMISLNRDSLLSIIREIPAHEQVFLAATCHMIHSRLADIVGIEIRYHVTMFARSQWMYVKDRLTVSDYNAVISMAIKWRDIQAAEVAVSDYRCVDTAGIIQMNPPPAYLHTYLRANIPLDEYMRTAIAAERYDFLLIAYVVHGVRAMPDIIHAVLESMDTNCMIYLSDRLPEIYSRYTLRWEYAAHMCRTGMIPMMVACCAYGTQYICNAGHTSASNKIWLYSTYVSSHITEDAAYILLGIQIEPQHYDTVRAIIDRIPYINPHMLCTRVTRNTLPWVFDGLLARARTLGATEYPVHELVIRAINSGCALLARYLSHPDVSEQLCTLLARSCRESYTMLSDVISLIHRQNPDKIAEIIRGGIKYRNYSLLAHMLRTTNARVEYLGADTYVVMLMLWRYGRRTPVEYPPIYALYSIFADAGRDDAAMICAICEDWICGPRRAARSRREHKHSTADM